MKNMVTTFKVATMVLTLKRTINVDTKLYFSNYNEQYNFFSILIGYYLSLLLSECIKITF